MRRTFTTIARARTTANTNRITSRRTLSSQTGSDYKSKNIPVRLLNTESRINNKYPKPVPLLNTESRINNKYPKPVPPPSTAPSSKLLTDVEIAVSKIFPAGFGWQLFSSIAENQGLASSSLGFYALTGLGDAMGVGAGHMLYQALKLPTVKIANTYAGTDWKQPDFKQEIKISTWLSCAAFFSGGMWQPTVNALSLISNDALLMVPATGLVCGSIFLAGLRAGRRAFDDLQPTYENAKADAWLSCKVGGGTGLFVATMGGLQHNACEGLLGITENMSLLNSCSIAGSSTFIGFLAIAGITHAGKLTYRSKQPSISNVSVKKTNQTKEAVDDFKISTIMQK
jgi:hypothetical protein